MLPYISFASFTTLLFLIRFFYEESSTYIQINSLFVILLISSVIYIFLLRSKLTQSNLLQNVLIILIFGIITPSYLQTDQYRYVWDGLSTVSGINPYRYSPVLNPMFSQFDWAHIINHPSLSSIYPPFAQVLFAISTYLNPYFSFDSVLHLTSVEQVLIGWKVLIAFVSVGVFLMYRYQKWYLILCHPLYLYTVFSNTHIDGVLVLLIGLLLMGISKDQDMLSNLSLTSAVLIKWYPFIFVPGLLFWINRKDGFTSVISTAILSFSIIAASVYVFFIGSQGHMFSSLGAYGRDWYFNGLFHHVFLDVLKYNLGPSDAINAAKYICIALAGLLYIKTTVNLYLSTINIKQWLFFTILIYLCFVPTLMPWYLLVLLPFVLLIPKKNTLLWAWPIVTLSSKAFFYEDKDPILIRYFFFFIVIYLLYRFLIKDRSYLQLS